MSIQSIYRMLCVLVAVPILLSASAMPASAAYAWSDFNPWFDFSASGSNLYFNPLGIADLLENILGGLNL